MAILREVEDQLHDPLQRDYALFEILRYFMALPTADKIEMIDVIGVIPYANQLPPEFGDEIRTRIHFANDLLPRVQSAMMLNAEESNPRPDLLQVRRVIDQCHILLTRARDLAETWQVPLRETYAAIARIGSQVAIDFMVNLEDPQIRGYLKTNLLFFSCLEMLAIGVKTGALQFGLVNPYTVDVNYFVHPESIRPIAIVKPGDDKSRIMADLVLGRFNIDTISTTLDGDEFIYLI